MKELYTLLLLGLAYVYLMEDKKEGKERKVKPLCPEISNSQSFLTKCEEVISEYFKFMDRAGLEYAEFNFLSRTDKEGEIAMIKVRWENSIKINISLKKKQEGKSEFLEILNFPKEEQKRVIESSIDFIEKCKEAALENLTFNPSKTRQIRFRSVRKPYKNERLRTEIKSEYKNTEIKLDLIKNIKLN